MIGKRLLVTTLAWLCLQSNVLAADDPPAGPTCTAAFALAQPQLSMPLARIRATARKQCLRAEQNVCSTSASALASMRWRLVNDFAFADIGSAPICTRCEP
jgi:hypothetical protein